MIQCLKTFNCYLILSSIFCLMVDDVNDIKKAVTKLKKTNWLYKNIDENSVDDAAKRP